MVIHGSQLSLKQSWELVLEHFKQTSFSLVLIIYQMLPAQLEITSFIMWYMLMLFACGITIQFSGCCTPEYVVVLVVTLL